MESTLYASRFGKPPPCYHCGSTAIDTKSYKEMLQQYKSVYPACNNCKESGKKEECVEKTKRQKAIKRPIATATPQQTTSAKQPKQNESQPITSVKQPKQNKSQPINQNEVKPINDQPKPAQGTTRKTQSKINFRVKPSVEMDLTDDTTCSICKKPDDSKSSHKVDWVDCDM